MPRTPGRGAAHRTDLGFVKTDRAALMRGDQDILLPVGQAHIDQRVVLVQVQGAQARAPDVLQVAQHHALGDALTG